MKRKICVITGSRAEFGLLRFLMHKIQEDQHLTLQIIVTGMHLIKKYGYTVSEIENDGFHINHIVNIPSDSTSPKGVTQSMAQALSGFAEAFEELKPDLVVVLGDRFEIFSAAIAAHVARIPIAHIHGGEASEGMLDEAFRHSITKMSQLHFVSTKEYKNKVVQLGENPKTVFLVGGLGIDALKHLNLLDRQSLELQLNFKFGKKNLLVTFHPVTLENKLAKKHIQELLFALADLKDTKIIFTMPNSDIESDEIFKEILKFVQNNPNSVVFNSLGQLKYFSCIAHVDGVIGNSSSGLLEVPSFKKATIDIGDRQLGRIKADSVISCAPRAEDIKKSISEIYSPKFQKKLLNVKNPYEIDNTTQKILSIIKKVEFDNLLKKKFYNLGKII